MLVLFSLITPFQPFLPRGAADDRLKSHWLEGPSVAPPSPVLEVSPSP